MGRKPDFIGIGVQKGGTSWLAACLNAHPQIAVPIKETGFFSKWYEVGKERYEEKMDVAPSGVLVGEFSTGYFHDRVAMLRILADYPTVSLVVVLREPVSRVESIIRHRDMRGREWNVGEAIERSRYSARLSEWMVHFPDIKVVWYDDIVDSPYQVVKGLYQWLGVDDHFVPEIIETRVNRSISPRYQWLVRVFDFVGKVRYWRWVKRIWWRPWFVGFRDRVKRFNSSGSAFSLNRKEKRILENVFEEDNMRLEQLVGRLPWRWYE